MLELVIPERECFDEEREEFFTLPRQTLQLEHSLVSISKWESKWRKPFLGTDGKTREETLDYIRCMTITQNIKPHVYNCLPSAAFNRITEYIDEPMTATWFSEQSNPKISREVITSEIIYHAMIVFNVPFECQKWHINRLLTLLRICNIKNQTPKKRGRGEMLAQRRALNEARRSQFNTKG